MNITVKFNSQTIWNMYYSILLFYNVQSLTKQKYNEVEPIILVIVGI